MRIFTSLAVIAALAHAGHASVLQLDVNAMSIQARNSSGAASAFTGTNHTGSLELTLRPGRTILNKILRGDRVGGEFIDQGFNGVLTDLSGRIDLLNGIVQGGFFTIQINGVSADPDTYRADIVSGSGRVDVAAIGGFTVDGLTFRGAFDDASFGNVDVSEFFGGQTQPDGLTGSFLQFNFRPNASGAGNADVDIFVVPAPGAVGLLALAGLAIGRRRR